MQELYCITCVDIRHLSIDHIEGDDVRTRSTIKKDRSLMAPNVT